MTTTGPVYCGLCDGEHEPRDCPATRTILASEGAANEIAWLEEVWDIPPGQETPDA